MIRTFNQHKVRRQQELSDCLWQFHTGPRSDPAPWQAVQVPGCWECLPGLENYRGVATYQRDFTVEGDAPRAVRLEFKGVSHTAAIYVDGAPVANHYNAYTIFSAVVQNLAPGAHTLTVEADNRFSEQSALHIPNDYMTYGGIIRPVVLEQLGAVYLAGIRATPRFAGGCWYAELELAVVNTTAEPQRCTPAAELAGAVAQWSELSLAPGETAAVKAELCLPGAEAWSMETPRLYTVTATLRQNGATVDDLIDRTGLREVKIEGKDLLLNGKKVRIKGFCRHEDAPAYGCALPFAAIQNDLVILKDLGANSVRTSHYPNTELFLDLCDEQGILVWEENHARGLSEQQMRNPNFERQAEDCIREMIPAHYNHPCIYIWGILNECASETEYGRGCYAKQYELIRSLDPSRPRSSASCKFKTDLCFDLPEVVSYNIYPEWYHDAPAAPYLADLYDWVQTGGGAGKPFLITETGAGAIYGFRTPTHDKWSEEYQAEVLRDQISAVLGQPVCTGIYIWQFCDVRVSREWFSSRPRSMNNKGVVDEYRRPKLSYATVKELFGACGNYRE